MFKRGSKHLPYSDPWGTSHDGPGGAEMNSADFKSLIRDNS